MRVSDSIRHACNPGWEVRGLGVGWGCTCGLGEYGEVRNGRGEGHMLPPEGGGGDLSCSYPDV